MSGIKRAQKLIPIIFSQYISVRKPPKLFLLFLIIFGLLVFKNPFSGNNIISNLEPSPDAMYYLNTTQNFIHGRGLTMELKGVRLEPSTPQLYALTLSPLYKLFNDPRSFYITNVIFGIISLGFFFAILETVIQNIWIRVFLLFCYVTDFIIYWYPQVAMSENLLLSLFMISLWVIFKPPTLKKSIIISILAFAILSTKYVAWPITVSLLFVYTLKLWTANLPVKKYPVIFAYFLSAGISFLGFCFLESISQNITLIQEVTSLVSQFISLNRFLFQSSIYKNPIKTQQNLAVYYSIKFISSNLTRYMGGIIGGPEPVANMDMVMIPALIGLYFPLGIWINMFFTKYKLAHLYFLLSCIGVLGFILFFYETDARYILFMISLELLVFGVSLDKLITLLRQKKLILSAYVIFIFCWTVVGAGVLQPVFSQLKVNFATGEAAPNYQSIMVLNQYFSKSNQTEDIVITTLSPFMVNFFGNDHYQVLPLSQMQNFTATPKIWGINSTKNLLNLYKSDLNKGQNLYLLNYKTNTHYFYNRDYLRINRSFVLTPGINGCDNSCNIYRLSLKRI